MGTLLLLFLLGQAADGPYAPADAYEIGSRLAYYGSVDEWNRRFFYEHLQSPKFRPGRLGQRQMLDIVEGRPRETVRLCRQALHEEPHDLESLFNLAVAWVQLGELDKALQSAERAVDAGLPPERFLAGPRDLLQRLTASDAFHRSIAIAHPPLLHGPLLGSVTESSARFWIRTTHEVPVQVVVGLGETLSNPVRSQPATTRAARDYTAVVVVDGLQPETEYHYALLADGQQVLPAGVWKFHTYPRAGTSSRFRVGFGGGAGYVPENERMWDVLNAQRLAAFLFLGDNVYIDLPQEVCGLHHYTYYRRQSRPEFRRLVASTAIYAIWDDHDCAIDDVFCGPYVDKPSWKPSMWELFRNNWNNPSYGDAPQQPGCWFRFSIADVDFFMLDGRYYRTNFRLAKPTMLGPTQKAWLFKQLTQSDATFKVLVSPVPWAFDAKDTADTWRGYPEERDEIFNFLSNNRIDGVFLLSADRHRSDARRIERRNGYPLYEFESSRLTNGHMHEPHGETLFVYTDKCSFGRLTFNTRAADPEATFQIVNIDGHVVDGITLKKSQLMHASRP